MSKGHSDSNYAWWQWLSVTDVWWSLKWWEVCRCGMCEKWDEMWCKAMWSPLSWISDSVDFWSCGKATTLVQHYIIKRKLIELLCTNKWQQSTLEGDDSSWEQKTSLLLLYTPSSGIASSWMMCSCLLYYFQNSPILIWKLGTNNRKQPGPAWYGKQKKGKTPMALGCLWLCKICNRETEMWTCETALWE